MVEGPGIVAEKALGGGAGWRFWIDRGGTFTDVVGRSGDGRLVVRKLLSVQPGRAGDPAVTAIRELLGLEGNQLDGNQAIPAGLIAELRLGTTVATNALLERRGEPVLLLINRGFADLLAIGDQHRPDIFALQIRRPQPLRLRTLEVAGRLAADGSELEPLGLDGQLEVELRRALAEGYRSVAVALIHSYRNPSQELALERWLHGQGVTHVALSHRLSGQPRLVPRGHTALVEAAVAPILRAYLEQVQLALGAATPLRVMRSSGSLAPPALLHAKDTILSGPAGGMVGAVAVARQALLADGCADLPPIVGFDMGGTSTDVFHFDPSRGEAAWERSAETEIAGLRLQAPMLPVHTVAAGGGSIIDFDSERLRVGPESAGADPGPAAYRLGGPATITDANLLLGRLPAQALPSVFGPAGDQPPDLEAVRQRFSALASAITSAHRATTPEQVAEGALCIAIERMAEAMRRISIQRGHDIRTALLVSYGAAAGQHACRLAELLGIRRVLLHPLAGVLSAYGIGMAEQRQLRERAVRAPLAAAQLPALEALRDQLAAEATVALRAAKDLGPQQQPRLELRLELRYPGSERGLEVSWPQQHWEPQALVAALQRRFVDLHRLRYGYVPADQQLVVERLMVEAAVDTSVNTSLDTAIETCVDVSLEKAVEGAVDPALHGDWFGDLHNAYPGYLAQDLAQDLARDLARDLSSQAENHANQAAHHGPMVERLAGQGPAQPTCPAQPPGWLVGQQVGQQLPTTPVWLPQPAALDPAQQRRPPADGLPEAICEASTSNGVATISTAATSNAAATSSGAATSDFQATSGLHAAGSWQAVPLWRREQLAPATLLRGPAVVMDVTTTLMLETHWQARVLADGALLLERQSVAPIVASTANYPVHQVVPQSVESAAAGQTAAGQTAAQKVDRALEQEATQTPSQAAAQEFAPAAGYRSIRSLEPLLDDQECDPGLGQAPDPVLLELFNHRFAAIAEQMGVQLQQSSRSVNIRERLDFSCALFDGQGRLVANAPHIPVHLGSMGESVVALLQAVGRGERPPLRPGDVILSNDPYAGGTHLPDITAITPIFAPAKANADADAVAVAGIGIGMGMGVEVAVEAEADLEARAALVAAPEVAPEVAVEPPLFFVASRGHHADVGGITPGSMPAFSTSIEQEGLLLRNLPFLENGVFDRDQWLARLAAGPHPVRNPDQLLADLQAQVAANRLGERALQQLIAREGLALVQAYMVHGRAHAAAAVRRLLARLSDGAFRLELDDGSCIQVAVRVDRQARRAELDFSGSSAQQAGNRNAPLAVTKAVVLYVLRCLVAEEIPLNAGCFEPISLIVPLGCLLNPRPPAAVVAGNVETSQAATNALFAALGVQAAAQGTMNNLSFGDTAAGAASRQYYETICGGTGAGIGADGLGFSGAAAVQSHMTNSRITDPEILEERYPVRLEWFGRRRGSGGLGRWVGGDGVIRQIRALEALSVSVLSSCRRVPPFGLAGGGAGACGRNLLLKLDGTEELLPGSFERQLQAGEALRIETPGGGAYGAISPGPLAEPASPERPTDLPIQPPAAGGPQ
jgi:N-methylhydantoinase B/oxoprolinase/acetone carboxylase alpha subunit/N-methylhydantoinase A/oxoprolinase/acetone carboxylase beta subunit